jgi:hypothetical protein
MLMHIKDGNIVILTRVASGSRALSVVTKRQRDEILIFVDEEE